jgi:hypothetical protein
MNGMSGVHCGDRLMKLLIDDHIVLLTRLPFGNGHILQVLVPSKGDLSVHRALVGALRARRPSGGVMDVEVFQPHERRDGQSEIRVLEGLELEIIDLCRMLGYGFEQISDDPPDSTYSN